MASPSEGSELSFERDIKSMFRTKDRDSMLPAFDLFDYGDGVSAEVRVALDGYGDNRARQVRRRPRKEHPARGGDLDQILLASGRKDFLSHHCLRAILDLPAARRTLNPQSRYR